MQTLWSVFVVYCVSATQSPWIHLPPHVPRQLETPVAHVFNAPTPTLSCRFSASAGDEDPNSALLLFLSTCSHHPFSFSLLSFSLFSFFSWRWLEIAQVLVFKQNSSTGGQTFIAVTNRGRTFWIEQLPERLKHISIVRKGRGGRRFIKECNVYKRTRSTDYGWWRFEESAASLQRLFGLLVAAMVANYILINFRLKHQKN